MKTLEKIFDLQERTLRIKAGGGKKAIEKQHNENKLTARERLEKLLDAGTFTEIDTFVSHRCTNFDMKNKDIPGEGVVTGFGKIEERLVYIFAQDFTVIGGTLGEMHAAKICKILDMAMEMGAPVIGLLDSGGARIQEAVDAMAGYGSIFYRNTLASGVIPQISVIVGSCAGGASYSPALTDYVFMVKNLSKMFITGPEVLKAVTGELVGVEELGGAMTHNTISGVAHFATEDEAECFTMLKKLLGYLPSNYKEQAPRVETQDSVDRQEESLNFVVPHDESSSYDMQEIIEKITDDQEFFQTMPYFAPNSLTGFARIGGVSVGIIANQPKFKLGGIDIDVADKISRHIRFCDAFNIPLVSFVDSPGYVPGIKLEYDGMIRHGAKVLYAYAQASVPKITIMTGRIGDLAYLTMCPRSLGADQIIAWTTAEITRTNPYEAAARGIVDIIIEPKETRPVLANALKFLSSKKEGKLPKKHSTIPL